MKDEVSGDVSPGSISLSNTGFEEELLFSSKDWLFLWSFFPLCAASAAGRLRYLAWRLFLSVRSLVKRDTPLAASRRACFQCGGLVGPDVPLPRQRGANRPCRDRVSAASPCWLGAHACLRRDHDARALGAAPLFCQMEAAGCCLDLGDSDSFSACFQPCMSPIDRHRLVSDVVDGRCTLHARGSTNSCGSGHGNSPGVEHVNSCMGIHADSRGASAHGNSRLERGREVSGETETSSTCTLSGVWRPAVGDISSLQQASESLHDEAWVRRVTSSSLRISQEVEIRKGCVVTVSRLPTPDFATSAPGCGSVVSRWLGWTSMEKTARCGLWLFRGALRGGDVFSSLLASCDWVKKGSYHTAWSVFPPLSSYSCFPQTGERCGPVLTSLWRAVAPLTKTWCAEEEVPTAANLNLDRGRFSRVAWHSDNEPLFGVRGDPKLIVSTSFGTWALFKWKGKSCPDNEANSCWLDHGDLLVMEWWTSSFIVRILVWNRSRLTLRSGGSNNMLLPVPF